MVDEMINEMINEMKMVDEIRYFDDPHFISFSSHSYHQPCHLISQSTISSHLSPVFLVSNMKEYNPIMMVETIDE